MSLQSAIESVKNEKITAGERLNTSLQLIEKTKDFNAYIYFCIADLRPG